MTILRWAVTVTSGVCAYPLDSVKRRMMMTAGEKVNMLVMTLPRFTKHMLIILIIVTIGTLL